jgi:hypothetical protein
VLPPHFEVPFSFRGDVVMRGRVHGASTDRCVFDTGAARTVVRVPDLRLVPGLIVADGMASVRLEMEGVDLGDVVARVRLVPGLDQLEVYVGASELRDRCWTIDYARSIVGCTREPLALDHGAWSAIGDSRGRPTITLITREQAVPEPFVLDTGSDASWVFPGPAAARLARLGEQVSRHVRGECGLGDVVASEVLVVRDARVGGRSVTLELVCAGEGDFGGAAARGPDGGIVGAGALARSGHELQIIDFVSNRFVLA